MERTARVFFNNRSQAVRIPKEFRLLGSEVFIRKEGENIILSPRPESWDDYLVSGPVAPEDFMTDVEALPIQERKF